MVGTLLNEQGYAPGVIESQLGRPPLRLHAIRGAGSPNDLSWVEE
jgi:hypothetical protein